MPVHAPLLTAVRARKQAPAQQAQRWRCELQALPALGDLCMLSLQASSIQTASSCNGMYFPSRAQATAANSA